MTTFTIKLTVEIEAETQNEALLKFRDEYLDWRIPVQEVEIAPVPKDRWNDLAAADIQWDRTPAQRFVYRSKEFDGFKEALDEGAIYRLPAHIETHKANEMLRLAEKCIGSDAGMKVKEW